MAEELSEWSGIGVMTHKSGVAIVSGGLVLDVMATVKADTQHSDCNCTENTWSLGFITQLLVLQSLRKCPNEYYE